MLERGPQPQPSDGKMTVAYVRQDDCVHFFGTQSCHLGVRPKTKLLGNDQSRPAIVGGVFVEAMEVMEG